MEVKVERIDDVPLLLAVMKEMGLAEVLDEHLSPHGNWGRDVSSLSLGQTVVTWLAYILSQGDHRLSAVQSWVENLQTTLQTAVHPDIRPLDLSDDRLGRALGYLAEEADWAAVERALGQRLIQVYALAEEVIRTDASTVSTYAEVQADGLVQFGYSKTHRPDLPQVKIALATLDPMGMPLVSLVRPGDRADDPLYLPLVRRAHQIVGAGKLYVGDSKMAALQTRATLQAWGDTYLCPAPRSVVSAEETAAYVQAARQQQQIAPWRLEREGKPPLEGEGFCVCVSLTAEVEGKVVKWEEERWVLRSQVRHQQALQELERRLTQAEEALEALNRRGRGRRRYPRQEALAEQVEALLQQYGVAEWLTVSYRCEAQEREVRAYKGRPARVERREDWFVAEVQRQEEALAAHREQLGWRVYLTNGAAQGRRLPATHIVQTYHGQYRIEQGFGRMRGCPIGITPMHVRRDVQRKGLLHLFSLALRVLTVMEYRVREALAQAQEALAGLYEGNPKRRTRRPTAERLLRAFRGLNLTAVRMGERVLRHVSVLTDTQQRILRLLGLSERLYTGLAAQSSQPP